MWRKYTAIACSLLISLQSPTEFDDCTGGNGEGFVDEGGDDDDDNDDKELVVVFSKEVD